MPLLSAHPSST
uniref:Uncharacterized protein n=1 Tax=Arundo donax TaxID=35708 RepID=A0A0A9CGD1_ARUDO